MTQQQVEARAEAVKIQMVQTKAKEKKEALQDLLFQLEEIDKVIKELFSFFRYFYIQSEL